VRQRALAVGHGGGNAIHIQAHAAHAEGGAGAVAAHGQLQVLGVVLAVLDLQAGHAGQSFGQVDLQLAVTQLLAIEHRGRGGQGLQAGGAGGGTHLDRLQRGGLGLGVGRRGQAGEQEGEGGRPAGDGDWHAEIRNSYGQKST